VVQARKSEAKQKSESARTRRNAKPQTRLRRKPNAPESAGKGENCKERDEANGLLNSDDEEENESDATESEASDSSDSDSADESDNELAQARKKRGHGLNRFGQAFQEVVEETGARVRIDSFEHSVVEVRKEDLAGFLEALSLRSVVG
jgi:cell division control protein 45